MPKVKQQSALALSIRATLFSAVQKADREIEQSAVAKTVAIVKAWDDIFCNNPRADVVAALHPNKADRPERGSYLAKILTNANTTFRLFEADREAYTAVFVKSAKRWDLRLDDVRAKLAARAAVAAEAAIGSEEIARELAQKPGDVIGAMERAKPAIERRMAELHKMQQQADAKKADRKALLERAKFDAVAAARVFADRCVADSDRGIVWLTQYVAELTEIIRNTAKPAKPAKPAAAPSPVAKPETAAA